MTSGTFKQRYSLHGKSSTRHSTKGVPSLIVPALRVWEYMRHSNPASPTEFFLFHKNTLHFFSPHFYRSFCGAAWFFSLFKSEQERRERRKKNLWFRGLKEFFILHSCLGNCTSSSNSSIAEISERQDSGFFLHNWKIFFDRKDPCVFTCIYMYIWTLHNAAGILIDSIVLDV